jgi:pilus assembly protein CpaC
MLQPSLRKLLIASAAIAAPLLADLALTSALADDIVVAANSTASQSVKVGLNKSLVIDLPRDARDILVSNPGIADAVIRTPTRIYVTGVAVGQSNVIVFDRAGAQIVSLDLQVERDTSDLSRMIARLIPNSNVNVEIVSDNVVLTGSVANASDSQKAQDIASIFVNGGAQVQQQAQQSSGGGGAGGAAGAGGASGSSGGSGSSGSVNISLGGGGGSSSPPTSKVINMLTIEGEDQVQLKVTVAEVQRNIAKQLGVDISGSLGGSGLAAQVITSNPFAVANKTLSPNTVGAGFGNPFSATPDASNFSITLHALEQTGAVKELAEPTLTAISGEKSSFLAGGEFPVPTGRDQSGNITITFKQFGVALDFTPVVLSEGRISMHVQTEDSELTSQGAFTLTGTNGQNLTIPGLQVRRAETTLELPSGGSMVLGGLLEDNVRQSIGALPGLGQLPVLGPLFRSRDFQSDETELVIIVTPYLVKPVPRSALATPDQGFAPASDAQSILLGNLNRVYGNNGNAPDASYQYRGQFGFIYQ